MRLRVAAFALTVVTLACSSNEPAAPAEPQPSGSTAQPTDTNGEGLDIQFQSKPDPPESGSNTIEVTVRQRNGTPVTDAAVTAVFSMPPMPAMNMPAMRSDAPLTHVGAGTYRGAGELTMGGTWNVNVTVTRGAETLGSSRFSIVAK